MKRGPTAWNFTKLVQEMLRSHFTHKQGKGCESTGSHLWANWCQVWKHVAHFINSRTWLLSNPACLCQKICGSKQSISGRQFGHLQEATCFFGLLLIYCWINGNLHFDISISLMYLRHTFPSASKKSRLGLLREASCTSGSEASFRKTADE